MIRITAITCFLIAAAAYPAWPEPSYDAIVEGFFDAFDRQDLDECEKIAEELKRQNSALFKRDGMPYVLGVLALQLGEDQKIKKYFRSVVDAEHILADHALFAWAQHAEEQGDHAEAERLYRELWENYPDTIYRKEALYGQGRAAAEAGFEDRAIGLLAQVRKRSPFFREANATIADLYLQKKQPGKAREIMRALLEDDAADDVALKAAEHLVSLDWQGEKELHYLVGMAFVLNRDFRQGRDYLHHFTKAMADSEQHAKAGYYLGRAERELKRWQSAAAAFEGSVETDPSSRWAQRSLYALGHVYVRLKKPDKATQYFEKLHKRFPYSALSDDALLALARIASEREDDAEAMQYLRLAARYAKDRYTYHTAMLDQMALLYQRGELDSALALLSEEDHPALVFWHARTLELLGRAEEAHDAYHRLLMRHPNDYYGVHVARLFRTHVHSAETPLVTARQAFEAGDIAAARRTIEDYLLEAPRSATARQLLESIYRSTPGYGKYLDLQPFDLSLAQLEKRYQGNPHFKRAKALLRLRQFPAGARELENLDGIYNPRQFNLTLAWLYREGDRPHDSIRRAERIVSDLPQDYNFALLPPTLRELLYPIHFRPMLEQYADERSVDRYLVLAVMREESRFDKNAKSWASARGLMQFIPSTAREVAQQVGLPSFSIEQLYDPDVVINLGTRYLQNLLRRFRGNFFYAVAAYNGGETNVDAWRDGLRDDEPHRFILSIRYRETHNYVKKVMKSYWRYRDIYDGN